MPTIATMTPDNAASVQSKILVLALMCFSVLPSATEAGMCRIKGGEELKTHEIQYQASLRVDGLHVCGGTIISPKHILTAAHCLDGLGFFEPYEELSIVTGGLKLSDMENQHSVANISIHGGFVNGEKDLWMNDIAVITLVDEINFDENQAAASLPNAPIPSGFSGVVCGWGREDENCPYISKVLRKATVRVLTAEECRTIMKYPINDGQLCGLGGPNIGICRGDSGGPLVVGNTLVGISSWNVPCGQGVPDVFTNVYKYLDFVKEVMQYNN